MNALVKGEVPDLPERYSQTAREWVSSCLKKEPEERAGFQELLEHPFLEGEETRDIDMVSWIATATAFKDARAANKKVTFPLHTSRLFVF